MSLGKNLQFLRKKYNMTQEDLAEYLGVSRQSVSKWETDESYPDTDKIISLCDRFSVTMDSLVRGDLTVDNINEESLFSDESIAKNINNIDSETECSSSKTESKSETDNSNDNGFVEDNQDSEPEIENGQVFGSGSENESKAEKIQGAICGITMIIATAVFFFVGVTFGIWHPTWMSFVCGAFICAVVGIIFDIRQNKNDAKKISGGICGIIMLLCTIVYVLISSFTNLWHPAWVIFVVGGLTCAVIGIIGDLFDKKSK